MKRLTIIPMLALGVSLSCATPAPAPANEASIAPSPVASAPAGNVAPYPYTVDQIRASCHGRVVEYRMEPADKPGVRQRWEFSDVDPDTARITTSMLDDLGQVVGVPEVETATWAELHEHARFPRARTTITDDSIALQFGTLDCWRYVVVTPDGSKTLWFAKALAGPPVKMVVVRGGTTVLTMTMVANRS